MIPLHVFEPRYRQMLVDCLASEQVLALAKLSGGTTDDGRPLVRPTLGVGRIVAHEPLSDGRSIILLRGQLRARVVSEHDSDKAYRIVRARILPDRSPEDGSDLAQATLLRHLLRKLVAKLSDIPARDRLGQLTLQELAPGHLADAAGGMLLGDAEQRQHLLEQLSVVKRLDLVTRRVTVLLKRFGNQVHGDALN